MARLIAIGASQGGVAALLGITRSLPMDFPATVLIALHVGTSHSLLPSLLNDAGCLPARHARNREAIEPGCIFVAPPDHHMLVVDGHLELTRGPRENWARPAIDPLFRTAAVSYGPDVVGVVLTGRLNDGAAGLYEIKRRGGVAVVQDPQGAEAAGMPHAALQNVAVDYCLPLSDIPTLLNQLARAGRQDAARPKSGVHAMSVSQNDQPIAISCPECGGAMREEAVGSVTRFRCHIGHAMTAEIMAAAQAEDLDKHLSVLLRALHERAAMCRDLAEKNRSAGNADAASAWQKAAEEAIERAPGLRKLAGLGWTHPEGPSSQPND